MTEEQIKEIRRRLDEDLSLSEFERDYRSTGEAATQFFQDLFVQILNFEETTSALGDATWQDIPVHEWPNNARANAARLFAESGNFRVIYVELEKLTRTAERNTIQSLTRSDRTSGWAINGSFLTVFHAPDENIWHLVTPYEEGTDDITTGRPVLRRYTLGEGETHRTVSDALANMDASKGRLADLIDEAFRVKPVTEDFYENYKSAFDTLSKELRRKGLEIEDADRYAHTTLNRLMFFYYLQKKGWVDDRKDFVRWFHKQYEDSDDEDVFHQEWLSSLFFDGMNSPEGGEIDADLPSDVESAVAGLPYMNGGLFQPTEEDESDTFLSDSALKSVIEEFLEQYNFTVTEESPYDIDVAVDPAMLGKIYESLIAEQERGEAGIFYTPRVEVDLMCRMALYEQFCDHANDLDAEGKRRIVDFIFSEPQDWDAESSGETEQLENILHELRIVDPACGSGAFLVGMKQVLTELYRKLDTIPDYHLKEQIVNENLYGVDIKDWAVRVAEFRLWLSLVENEEELPDQEPVLPNFSFKLVDGDSIVQTINGEPIAFDELVREATGDVYQQLEHVINLKSKHFYGESELGEEEIEKEQRELLIRYIDQKIESLESDTNTQGTITGGETEESKETSAEAKKRINELEATKEKIREIDNLFVWELTFPELMLGEQNGFDIVIGNPPYVRNESIVRQDLSKDQLEEFDEEELEAKKSEYKRELNEYVERKFDVDAGGQIDLYLYFFFAGVDLLRDGGTFNLITSNSWLDTEFGEAIQELLLLETEPNYVVDNVSERSFEEADINTVITVAQKKSDPVLKGEMDFVSVSVPFSSLEVNDLSRMLTGADENYFVMYEEVARVLLSGEFRRIRLTTDALWRLGGGAAEERITELPGEETNDFVYSEKTGISQEQRGIESFADESTTAPRAKGEYGGEKWGQFIHAPDSFFDFLSAGDESLTQLDSLGKVDSGINTRANRFFYLYEVPQNEWDSVNIKNFSGNDYPDNCQVVRSEIGTWKGRGCTPPVDDTFWMIEDEYLRTVIQSPRQSMSIRFDIGDLDTLVLSVYKDWPELEDTYVRDYIEYAKSSKEVTRKSNEDTVEVLKVNERPELSKRKQSVNDGSNAVWWYEILDKNYSRLLLPKSCGYSFRVMLSSELVPVDNNLYCFVFDDDPSEKELVGMTLYMNSTIVALLRELYGRSNLGQGGLKTEGVDWSRMPVPDPETLEQIAESYGDTSDLFDRKIDKIWDEIEKEDKQRLDQVVFDEIGIDPSLVEELQERTVDLVRARQKRANST